MKPIVSEGREEWAVTTGIPLAVTILCGISAVFFYSSGLQLLLYPVVTAAVASMLYLAGNAYSGHELGTIDSRTAKRTIQIACFIGIAALVTLSRAGGPARPDGYFFVYLTVSGLILVTAMMFPSNHVLFQVILLALATRISIFRAAPVIGKDTTTHQSIVGYLLETGDLVPASVSYYHWYPVSHVTSASTALLSGLSSKFAFFLTTSVTAVLSVVLVYLATLRLYDGQRSRQAGLIAALLVVLSWPHLNRTAIPIAQTMSLTLVSGFIYLLIRDPDRRFQILLIGLLVSIGAVHVLAPILLSGLFVIFLTYRVIVQQYEASAGKVIRGFAVTNRAILGCFVVVYMLEYFIFTRKLSLQVYRISYLFTGGGSLSGAVSNAGGSLLSTEILLSVPPLLLFAGSLLITGLFVLVGAYDYLEALVKGTLDHRYGTWAVTGGLLFAGFSVALFVGHGSSITRGLPTAIVIVAPICGIAAAKICRTAGTEGTVAILIILVAGAYLGVASPTSAVPERTSGFQPMLTESEVAVIDFVHQNDIESYTHPYLAGKINIYGVNNGEIESLARLDEHSNQPPPSILKEYNDLKVRHPYVFREYYSERGVVQPETLATSYDSGKTRILLPRARS